MEIRTHVRAGRFGVVTVLATVMMLVMIPATAGAVALTFESPGSQIFQQTLNSPCIIGNPSCNNPGGFGFTTLPVTTDGTYSSPTYTVGQIRSIVGDLFSVGLDINQATQNVPAYTLFNDATSGFAFTLNINGGAPEFTLTCNAITGCVTALVNNGNGFSDALIKGFDLTAFLATDSAVFTTTYINDTDGREQFFLVSSPVPEPSTLLLVGTLLAGLGVWARRGLKRPSTLPA